MKLFPDNKPLSSISINIPGKLIRTKLGNRFLLLITDQFTKLTWTIPINIITPTAVAHAFLRHWVLVYGPPQMVIYYNVSQLIGCFFKYVYQIIGTKNF